MKQNKIKHVFIFLDSWRLTCSRIPTTFLWSREPLLYADGPLRDYSLPHWAAVSLTVRVPTSSQSFGWRLASLRSPRVRRPHTTTKSLIITWPVVVVVAYECSTERMEVRLWPEMERLALKSGPRREYMILNVLAESQSKIRTWPVLGWRALRSSGGDLLVVPTVNCHDAVEPSSCRATSLQHSARLRCLCRVALPEIFSWHCFLIILRFYRVRDCECIITVLLSTSVRLSVRPSVWQTRALWQNEIFYCQNSYTYKRSIHPLFWQEEWLVGDDPLFLPRRRF